LKEKALADALSRTLLEKPVDVTKDSLRGELKYEICCQFFYLAAKHSTSIY